MPVPQDLFQLGIVLLSSALVGLLTRRLGLPYTVGLVLAGMAIHVLPLGEPVRLSRDLIFFVFLPPLVFEAALYIRWRELARDLPVIGLLATVGVVLAAGVTTLGMHYGAAWSWPTAVVFGAMIAATDPVSVIATFKEAGIHGRLRLLVEAESLLNDGTAVVAFGIALALVGGAEVDFVRIAQSAFVSIGGGIAVGAATAWALMLLAGRTTDHLIEITCTTLAAYGSFLIAEHLHCSGILATLAAGLVAASFAHRGAISERGRTAVESFWEYATFAVNSFVFVLIGGQVARQSFHELWWPAVVGIVAVLASRAVTIYPLCAVFRSGPLAVASTHQHVLFWGGLRGALALALALSLPAELRDRNEIVTTVLAVVLFSVFVQGLTMTPLLHKLGELHARRS